MKKVFKYFILSIEDREGATAVEYAIMLTLITAAIIITVSLLGFSTRDAFDTFNTEMSIVTGEKNCGNEDSPDDDDCGGGNDNK